MVKYTDSWRLKSNNFKNTDNMEKKTKVSKTQKTANCGYTVLAPVFVYEFLYNSDCCEGAASTISIHKTKKGAEMAMEFHKHEKLKEWEKECKEYPPAKEYPFDFDQWWGVRECELLP